MPTKFYLIGSPEELALEILYLKREVAHNYPDAVDKISLAVTADVIAYGLTPDGSVTEKAMKRAQAALAALEREGMVKEELGSYSMTVIGFGKARYLFGDFLDFHKFGENLLNGAKWL